MAQPRPFKNDKGPPSGKDPRGAAFNTPPVPAGGRQPGPTRGGGGLVPQPALRPVPKPKKIFADGQKYTAANTAYNSAQGSNLGSLGSMTIRGDGRRRVHLRANFSHVAASATTNLAVQIWLSSVGAGINVGGNELQYGYMYNPGGVYLPLFCEVELDPFTGTKDIHVTIHTTGAATVTTANPSDTGAAASPDAQSLASHSLIAEWIN